MVFLLWSFRLLSANKESSCRADFAEVAAAAADGSGGNVLQGSRKEEGSRRELDVDQNFGLLFVDDVPGALYHEDDEDEPPPANIVLNEGAAADLEVFIFAGKSSNRTAFLLVSAFFPFDEEDEEEEELDAGPAVPALSFSNDTNAAAEDDENVSPFCFLPAPDGKLALPDREVEEEASAGFNFGKSSSSESSSAEGESSSSSKQTALTDPEDFGSAEVDFEEVFFIEATCLSSTVSDASFLEPFAFGVFDFALLLMTTDAAAEPDDVLLFFFLPRRPAASNPRLAHTPPCPPPLLLFVVLVPDRDTARAAAGATAAAFPEGGFWTFSSLLRAGGFRRALRLFSAAEEARLLLLADAAPLFFGWAAAAPLVPPLEVDPAFVEAAADFAIFSLHLDEHEQKKKPL